MHSHAVPVSGELVLLFLASLAGSVHCVGMCGPYVALCAARLSPGDASPSLPILLKALFNAGRLAAYVLIGAAAGAFGQIVVAVGASRGLGGAVLLLAGLLAMVFGLALVGWVPDPANILRGLGIDRLLCGGVRSALRRPPYAAALILGSLQGALPCALVYGAASRAAVAGSPSGGAVTMLVFGLGTVPAIFGMSLVSDAVLRRVQAWHWAGLFMVALGMLLVLRGLAALGLLAHTLVW